MKSKITNLIVILCFLTISSQAQVGKSKQTLSPKLFVVLDITVNDTIMYEQYRIKDEPIIKKYDEKYLVRSGVIAFDKDPDKK
nr:hypothetical protein [Pseudopedobacter sp.]